MRCGNVSRSSHWKLQRLCHHHLPRCHRTNQLQSEELTWFCLPLISHLTSSLSRICFLVLLLLLVLCITDNQDCPLGRYSDRTALELCQECLPGLIASTTARSLCTNCASGKYQTEKGKGVCNGKYQYIFSCLTLYTITVTTHLKTLSFFSLITTTITKSAKLEEHTQTLAIRIHV